jgi:flagellar basal body-associated protein FliL
MKKNSKIVIVIAIIALIVTSFFVGSYVTEQKNSNARKECCSTLIMFAIDKAENGNLTDQGTMRGLISNVYAAYQFCDDSKTANQLHDLWNYLIFESDDNTDAAKDIALRELNAVFRSIKMTD